MPDSEPSETRAPPRTSRRSVVFAGALAGLGALIAAAVGSMFRFIVPAVLYEPPTAFPIGHPQDFPPNSLTFLPEHRLFVFNRPQGLSALSSVCTHLGCNVRRASGARGFECPCHGSTYDMLGNVSGGPAPKPLPWHPLSISRKGEVVVETAVQVGPEYVLVVTETEERA